MDILKKGLKDLNGACEHVLRTFEVRYLINIDLVDNDFLTNQIRVASTN